MINIVAWAYCTVRKAKNNTPEITIRINCPSSEGTKYRIGSPIKMPARVPMILNAKRLRVAL
ncbi:hypothetical protein D3C81_2246240 [compost metagenome]